jgi:hypothetical protein
MGVSFFLDDLLTDEMDMFNEEENMMNGIE